MKYKNSTSLNISMNEILKLFKIDLGITHNYRDEYFVALINSSIADLREKGIELTLENIEDQMLIIDYSAWKYRKRQEDVGIAMNIQNRIRNRIVKARGKDI